MRRKNRKLRKLIKNTLVIFGLILAMVLFVMASMHLVIKDTVATLVMIVSGFYISMFVYVNEVE